MAMYGEVNMKMFLISSAVAIIIAFVAYNVLTSRGMDTASVYSSSAGELWIQLL